MERDIDKAFGRTMMWVLLCVIAIFVIASVNKCSHTNDRPRGAERELTTLSDSIHEYEDGF